MIARITIRLISPAMIGGLQPRKLDPSHVLRPPSLRGMLRFWTRALAAGASLNVRDQETRLWGDSASGQKISILPLRISFTSTGELKLFPHKNRTYIQSYQSQFRRLLQRFNQNFNKVAEIAQSKSEMLTDYQTIITIAFRVPESTQNLATKLQAVVWTWLHLGAIGRRSRRGYGSLLWIPQSGDLLESFVDFNPQTDLASSSALEQYLRRGLAAVQRIWGVPDTSPRTIFPDQFTFKSTDQVFVGKTLQDPNGNVLTSIDDSPGGILEIIHGINETASGPRRELGRANPRQASPHALAAFSSGGWRLCAGDDLVAIDSDFYSHRYAGLPLSDRKIGLFKLTGRLFYLNKMVDN